jgi:hypothetical protein
LTNIVIKIILSSHIWSVVMTLFERNQQKFGRGVSLLLGFFLLFQVTLTGFAAAAAGDKNQEPGFGVVCQNLSDAAGNNQTDHPKLGGHHGLCCVLHFDSFAAPSFKASVTQSYAFVSQGPSSGRFQLALAPRLEPRSAPQSPRAPPAA